MTKQEIETRFRAMLLVYSEPADAWYTRMHRNYFYKFQIVQMPKGKKGGYMIQIKGGPISLQGWYMPDAGIERIQKIIQEIIRL